MDQGPININVGGTMYTTSAQTLIKFPDCRLYRMLSCLGPVPPGTFNKQSFIDRDGKMFRHILNFMRTNTLSLPENFRELDLLYKEAEFYGFPAMLKQLDILRAERIMQKTEASFDEIKDLECLALNIDSGDSETILISGQHDLVKELFADYLGPKQVLPAALEQFTDFIGLGNRYYSEHDSKYHVIRRSLNGKLNFLQAIAILLKKDFKIISSNVVGEDKKLNEYIFVREILKV